MENKVFSAVVAQVEMAGGAAEAGLRSTKRMVPEAKLLVIVVLFRGARCDLGLPHEKDRFGICVKFLGETGGL